MIYKVLFFFTINIFFFGVAAPFSIKVLDRHNHPLKDVQITCLEPYTNVITKDDGTAVLYKENISGSNNLLLKFPLILTKKDYKTLETNVAVLFLNRGSSQAVTLKLMPKRRKQQTVKRLAPVFVKSDPLENNAKKYISGKKLQSERQSVFNDITKTLQTMPGVSSSGSSMDASLYVQGGGEDEWTALYDDIYIPRPIRWDGAISMFNPRVIESLDFYTAGYGSAYGQGLSAVLDSRTVKPARKIHFYAAFDSGLEAMIWGPLGPSCSFLFNVRRIWFDLFASNPQTGFYQFPWIFDGNAKLIWKINKKNQISLIVYGSIEGMEVSSQASFSEDDSDPEKNYVLNPNANRDQESIFQYKDYNIITGLTWNHNFSFKSFLKTTISLTPHFGDYTQDFTGFQGFDAHYTALPFQFKSEWHVSKIKNHKIRTGIFYYLYKVRGNGSSKYGFFDPSGYYTNLETEWDKDVAPIRQTGLWAQDIWLIHKRLKADYGIRLDYYSPSKEWIPQPRGGISFEMTKGIEIAFHSGLYSRLSLPDEQSSLISPKRATQTIHLLPSFAVNKSRFHFRAEGFYKKYHHVTSRDYSEESGYNSKGTREVYGGDGYMKLDKRPESLFYGHISYTYQDGRETVHERGDHDEINEEEHNLPDVGKPFMPGYLRQHTFNASLNIKPFMKALFTDQKPQKGFKYTLKHQEFALTFKALSGNPYSPVTNIRIYEHPLSGKKYKYLYGAYNSQRTPPVINIDIKWTFPINKNAESFLTIINLIPKYNITGYRYGVKKSYLNREGFTHGDLLSEQAVIKVPVYDRAFQFFGGFRVKF